jgi:hypothetical protein
MTEFLIEKILALPELEREKITLILTARSTARITERTMLGRAAHDLDLVIKKFDTLVESFRKATTLGGISEADSTETANRMREAVDFQRLTVKEIEEHLGRQPEETIIVKDDPAPPPDKAEGSPS